MPKGDGTGPTGQGPRTGRGAGNCPQPASGNMIGVPGQGFYANLQNTPGNFGGYGCRRGFGQTRQGR